MKKTEQHNPPAFVQEKNKAAQLKRPEQSSYDSAIDYKTEFRTSAHRWGLKWKYIVSQKGGSLFNRIRRDMPRTEGK